MSSNIKEIKAKKAAKQKQSDLILSRLMIQFIIGMVGICAMLWVGKDFDREAHFIIYAMPVLMVVSVLAIAGAGVWFYMQRSRHVDESARIFTSMALLGDAAALLAAVFFYRFTANATAVVMGFIAALVLYFVYNIYKKDFFLYSVVTALGFAFVGMASMDGYSTLATIINFGGAGLAIVTAVLSVVLALMLKKGKGRLTLGDKKYKVADGKAAVYPFFVSAVVIAVGAVLALVLPAAATWAIFALLASYLVIAIAYTIKMM